VTDTDTRKRRTLHARRRIQLDAACRTWHTLLEERGREGDDKCLLCCDNWRTVYQRRSHALAEHTLTEQFLCVRWRVCVSVTVMVFASCPNCCTRLVKAVCMLAKGDRDGGRGREEGKVVLTFQHCCLEPFHIGGHGVGYFTKLHCRCNTTPAPRACPSPHHSQLFRSSTAGIYELVTRTAMQLPRPMPSRCATQLHSPYHTAAPSWIVELARKFTLTVTTTF
jgi:hypothetical protein